MWVIVAAFEWILINLLNQHSYPILNVLFLVGIKIQSCRKFFFILLALLTFKFIFGGWWRSKPTSPLSPLTPSKPMPPSPTLTFPSRFYFLFGIWPMVPPIEEGKEKAGLRRMFRIGMGIQLINLFSCFASLETRTRTTRRARNAIGWRIYVK